MIGTRKDLGDPDHATGTGEGEIEIVVEIEIEKEVATETKIERKDADHVLATAIDVEIAKGNVSLRNHQQR